jgi:hypothetical protein
MSGGAARRCQLADMVPEEQAERGEEGAAQVLAWLGRDELVVRDEGEVAQWVAAYAAALRKGALSAAAADRIVLEAWKRVRLAWAPLGTLRGVMGALDGAVPAPSGPDTSPVAALPGVREPEAAWLRRAVAVAEMVRERRRRFLERRAGDLDTQTWGVSGLLSDYLDGGPLRAWAGRVSERENLAAEDEPREGAASDEGDEVAPRLSYAFSAGVHGPTGARMGVFSLWIPPTVGAFPLVVHSVRGPPRGPPESARTRFSLWAVASREAWPGSSAPVVLSAPQAWASVVEAEARFGPRLAGLLRAYVACAKRGQWVRCVDLARLAVVLCVGGSYVDLDLVPGPDASRLPGWFFGAAARDKAEEQALPPMVVMPRGSDGWLHNCLVSAPPGGGSPFLQGALAALLRSATDADLPVVAATGPAALAAAAQASASRAVRGGRWARADLAALRRAWLRAEGRAEDPVAGSRSGSGSDAELVEADFLLEGSADAWLGEGWEAVDDRMYERHLWATSANPNRPSAPPPSSHALVLGVHLWERSWAAAGGDGPAGAASPPASDSDESGSVSPPSDLEDENNNSPRRRRRPVQTLGLARAYGQALAYGRSALAPRARRRARASPTPPAHATHPSHTHIRQLTVPSPLPSRSGSASASAAHRRWPRTHRLARAARETSPARAGSFVIGGRAAPPEAFLSDAPRPSN